MSRKSVLVGVGAILVLLGSLGVTLYLLVRHEPSCYRRWAVPAGPARKEHGESCTREGLRLYQGITNEYRQWGATFTQAQVNSFLSEGGLALCGFKLPKGISEPRVGIEADKIRLGFRYGSGLGSTIVTIDFRVWVPANETNVVALEVQSMHVGAVPMMVRSVLERLADFPRREKINVTMWRLNGNPVALLRFQSDSPRPTMQLKQLEVREGVIRIMGRSVNGPPRS
jgi:hypothetical protein